MRHNSIHSNQQTILEKRPPQIHVLLQAKATAESEKFTLLQSERTHAKEKTTWAKFPCPSSRKIDSSFQLLRTYIPTKILSLYLTQSISIV